MHAEHGVSVRRGCEAVGLPRSTYRYERAPKPDEPVIEALAALVERHPTIGFWQAEGRSPSPTDSGSLAMRGITRVSTASTPP